MRRPLLTTFLAAAAMVGTGCADSPEAPSAPPDPVLPNLAVVSATTIRSQINELLVDPARTAALFQLRRVQEDIQYRRKTLYLNALALAVIPLHERERHRIPPEKLEKLFQLLCNISHLIRPHLPPWLAAIDFCLINPGQLATDAKVQVVTNAFGGTVTTERQTFSLDIEPNSLKDAAGNPVSAVLVVVLPLLRQQPTEGEAHPCPEPWDKSSSGTTPPWYPDDEVDCYEEFYDLSVQPLVQFDPAAELEVCQLDPASGDPNAPSGEGVFGRLELFSKDVANEVRILGQDEDSGAEADALCDEDNIEHPIGPAGWSRSGVRNALLRLARAGSHGLSLFRPTVLYANNRPTHGDIVDELLFGNVVGAIDRGTLDVACVGTLPSGTYRNVTVPEDATCTMVGSNLTGTLQALTGSMVSARDNIIAGDVQAYKPRRVHIFGGSVGGTVLISEGTGILGIYDFVIDGVDVSKDVRVHNSAGEIWVVNSQFSEAGNIRVEDNVIIDDVPAPDLTIDNNSGPRTIQVLRNSGPGSKQVSNNNAIESISCFGNTTPDHFRDLGSSNNTAPTLEGQCAPAALPTSTTLRSAHANPLAVVGEAVWLEAEVTPNPFGAGGGQVEFFDGTTSLGVAALAGNGQASITVPRFQLAVHSLTARFGGTSSHLPSTSGALTLHTVEHFTTFSAFADAVGDDPTDIQNFQALAPETPVSSIINGVLNVASPFPSLEVWSYGGNNCLFGIGTAESNPRTQPTSAGFINSFYDLLFVAPRKGLAFNIVDKHPETTPSVLEITGIGTTTARLSINNTSGSEGTPIFVGMIASLPLNRVIVHEGLQPDGIAEEMCLDDFRVVNVP